MRPVEERPGWTYALSEIHEPGAERIALFHNDTEIHLWAWGETDTEREADAVAAIDEFMMKRLIQLWEQVQADDAAGGNVRIRR